MGAGLEELGVRDEAVRGAKLGSGGTTKRGKWAESRSWGTFRESPGTVPTKRRLDEKRAEPFAVGVIQLAATRF